MFETTKENKRMFNSIQSILVLMALLAFSWVDIDAFTLQFLSRARLDGVVMTGDLKADLEALKSDQNLNLSSIT